MKSESSRELIVRRTAAELRDGDYVNLGIGMPTLVANYVPRGMRVTFQSENGMLGVGPFPLAGEEDPDLINAGKQTITETPGWSYFSSAESVAMIRGGHIDLAVIDVEKEGLVLREMAQGLPLEQVVAATEARLVPDPEGVRALRAP